MGSYRTQPRFELILSVPPEQALKSLKTRLEQTQGNIEGSFLQNHAQLSITEKERHMWSPNASLEFEPEQGKEHCAHVYGIIGPSSSVWTMFMAGYFGLFFLAFVGITMGYSQWSIKQTPWGLYTLPIIGILIVCWYGFSQVGRRYSVQQVKNLQDFLDDTIAPHILKD